MINLKTIKAPRPTIAVAPESLGKMAKSGEWIAQPKKNGIYSFIQVGPGGWESINRHNRKHKIDLTAIRPALMHLHELVCDGPQITFLSEMVTGKVTDCKPSIMLHDMVALDGAWLEEWTFADRYEYMVADIGCNGHPCGMDIELGEGLTLARVFADLEGAYVAAQMASQPSTLEGIVCKRWDAPLGKPWDGGSDWQVKCRVPSRKYAF